jgi:hypothetical protein
MGAEVDAARKGAGDAVPEASGAVLAPWSGWIGVIHPVLGLLQPGVDARTIRAIIQGSVV